MSAIKSSQVVRIDILLFGSVFEFVLGLLISFFGIKRHEKPAGNTEC